MQMQGREPRTRAQAYSRPVQYITMNSFLRQKRERDREREERHADRYIKQSREEEERGEEKGREEERRFYFNTHLSLLISSVFSG